MSMNLQSTCSRMRSLAVSISGEQEPKAQILNKSVGRVLTRNPYSLVNTDCLLIVPVLGAQHLVPSETPPVVLLLCHSHDELVVRLIVLYCQHIKKLLRFQNGDNRCGEVSFVPRYYTVSPVSHCRMKL